MNKKRLSLILSALVLFTLVLSLTGCPTSWYIKKYAGNYSGTFTNKTYTRNWSGTIDASGSFSGIFDTGSFRYHAKGSVTEKGILSGVATMENGDSTIKFKGEIKLKQVSGSWYTNSDEKGTFTGEKN
ncbi:hypothetical protein E4O00_07375 [Treponema sp. OMZ 788]|uniref:hypothetical protein n=1 Tax=Treponema sp. OMZ 788 TaxID=2563664 RepID=UPI0020A3AB82|nr:hypothetical protein [Treponema sp. OMZ 788]UTC63760.1 hypothetical protein E4O00_07375 [Treponema sp. OMZ 788]